MNSAGWIRYWIRLPQTVFTHGWLLRAEHVRLGCHSSTLKCCAWRAIVSATCMDCVIIIPLHHRSTVRRPPRSMASWQRDMRIIQRSLAGIFPMNLAANATAIIARKHMFAAGFSANTVRSMRSTLHGGRHSGRIPIRTGNKWITGTSWRTMVHGHNLDWRDS